MNWDSGKYMYKNRHDHVLSRGQTLLELVIAMGVVAVIVTGLVVASTASLRYSQDSRLRSGGVKYAQEAIEVVRQIRDTQPWTTFEAYSTGTSKTWCLSSAGVFSDQGGGECPLISVGSPFTRSVTFTWNDPIMEVTSEVRWQVGSTQASTQLKTYFTQWK
jgi:Tfp pilus assembly protein PilV